jgi:uncharacterized protein with NRDE domain
MCTLIAIHRRVPGSPLVVAANRDEFLERPAEGPAIRPNRDAFVVAPLDLRGGGTWLGLSDRGVFAALTNLRSENPDPTRESRGLLVMEMLAATSAKDAARMLEALPERKYNPFNCYVADAQEAWVAGYRDSASASARVQSLEPGVHVIGNVDIDDADSPKLRRIRQRAEAAASGPPARLFESLTEICREHGAGEDPLGDTCVHLGDTYGTRSSILLDMSESPEGRRLHYVDGPPCVGEYQDFSYLLSELSRTPGRSSAGIPTRTAT